MALSGSSLTSIYSRHSEIEKQVDKLQKQVEFFQQRLGSVKIDDKQDKKQQSKPPPQPTTTTTDIQSGKYAVMISTKKKPVPIDVIAAYLIAEESIKSSGSKIKLSIADNDKFSTPTVFVTVPGHKEEISGNSTITRLLYRISGTESLNDIIETALIDKWVNKSTELNFMNSDQFGAFISELNNYLKLRSYLVGYNIKSADVLLYTALKSNEFWIKLSSTISSKQKGSGINILRWFNTINQSNIIQNAINKANILQTNTQKRAISHQKQQKNKNNKGKSKGKKQKKQKSTASASWDIGIPPEYNGKIVTRFPPEPSGYLHIGHAKAVFINWFISRQFNGKMIVRLDDTNPSKEKAKYVENILRDLETLGVEADYMTATSDYFDYYIKCCARVIKQGFAYVDDTPTKEMRAQRKRKEVNACRDRSIDENLELWNEMIRGSAEGIKCCVRIKLDPTSDNGTLRDPTIYRCNIKDAHHKHGMKYKVYPTYDFACPIVDSIEGVTHAFRSKEYNERNVQYKMIWDIVCKGIKYKIMANNPSGEEKELVCPNMFQFSRQEFTRTVLSKRRLSKLVEQRIVDGWDDPRLPTIQGIIRRGLQIEALKRFVMDQAMSTTNTEQEWDKLWTYNKRVLDPIVGRYFFVSKDYLVINLKNIQDNSAITVPLHPKKRAKDDKQKVIHLSEQVYVEKFSLNEAINIIKDNPPDQQKLILQSWGIINIDKINYDDKNPDQIKSIDASYEADNREFKKYSKCCLNWISYDDSVIPVKLVELDYLYNYRKAIKKDKDGNETKEMEIILEENKDNTWFETEGFGESALKLLSKGDIIQFIKRGFFIVDKPYLGRASQPAVLIYIPDGKIKSMSMLDQNKRKVTSTIGSKSDLIDKKNKSPKNKKKVKKKIKILKSK